MELTCPKCHGPMRTYERNGVHVDQCSECRGIFLDRGELERLMDAESNWNEQHAAPRAAASSREGSRHDESRYEDSRHGDPRYEDQHRSSSGHGSGGSGAGLGAVVNEVLSQVGKSKSSHGSSYGHGYPKKRKESFLGDLFG